MSGSRRTISPKNATFSNSTERAATQKKEKTIKHYQKLFLILIQLRQ